jgi:transcription antitermination factor NusG
MRVVVRHARQSREKLKPFFPGYLFVQLEGKTANWVAISSTKGTLGPVRYG